MIFERNILKRDIGAGLLAALLVTAPFAPAFSQDLAQDPLTPELSSAAEQPAQAATLDVEPIPADQVPADSSLPVSAGSVSEGPVPVGPAEAEAKLAAETAAANAPASSSLLAISNAKGFVRDATLTPESVDTLFFTAWQHALLEEAKKGFVTAPANTGAVAGQAAGRDPGIREISLGGIAYSASDRWTVWLNGVRVTPNALPDAIMDIKVSRAYIDLKWFDGYTNKIYPIRLRPQERFNLDSRIFLPGTGAL